MPRFYFNINGAGVPTFDDGEVLPDSEAAWREAITIAGELFEDLGSTLRPGQSWKLEVLDEQRRALYSITVVTSRLC